jgi:small subunit ribosomal protein S8
MMTDPIADMLTRIRNANAIERNVAEMPATKLKAAVAQVLKDEGFILDFHVGKYGTDEQGNKEFKPFKDAPKFDEAKLVLRVYLKYGEDGEKVIRHIARSSRPGRRYYQGKRDLKRVLDGLGIAILSTSKGVMSDRRARTEGVGGEVLCTVW